MNGKAKPYPKRDSQFKHIKHMRETYTKHGLPVISIDTKKKELIGNFKRAGTEYRPKKSPRPVNDHDFCNEHAVPYGIYDCNKNFGFVNLGHSKDTAKFAVESIRRWWNLYEKIEYPDAKKMLIFADSGGSNGYNRRMFKKYLVQLSQEIGVVFRMCHYPPGCSKYNPVEHRFFSEISVSTQAQPITSLSEFAEFIRHTTTETGLRAMCVIDNNIYPTKEKIGKHEYDALPIRRSSIVSELNYWIGEG